MAGDRLITRKFLEKHLPKCSDASLTRIEGCLTNRMADIARFCPWPALEESLAQDIAMVWREQKIRQRIKEHKSDMEFDIINAGRFIPNIHGEFK